MQLSRDTVAPESLNQKANEPESDGKDYFDQQVDKVTPLLHKWNFNKGKELTLTDSTRYKYHWGLRSFFQPMPISKKPKWYPTSTEWNEIRQIRQIHFKKAWEFILEEWTLADRHAARDWQKIMLHLQYRDSDKPPRTFWLRGNKIYFIVGTAAIDWSAHANELVREFSGRNRWLVQLFNHPLDVVTYKKKKKGSNGGVVSNTAYYYKPDTIGTYYYYTLFYQLLNRYKESEMWMNLVLYTYIYGDKTGIYENVSEEFIGIKSRLSDPDLGPLDLVGKPLKTINDQWDLSLPNDQDLAVIAHDGDVLILHFVADKVQEKKVDWFHFLRTSLAITSVNDLPDHLKYFSEDPPKNNLP